jgi:hypothetical protein
MFDSNLFSEWQALRNTLANVLAGFLGALRHRFVPPD